MKANLNFEQQLAVETIEGPVMVIAGPGTGKTQILANRIAHILEQTDSQAQNILCLTYTDAGTVAMKQRLLDFIGNDAHRVSIHTFHSFCNRVIQENGEAFQYRSMQPISTLERIEILHDIATHLDNEHVLKRMKGNVGYLVGQLQQLFSWMKKENVSSSEIELLCSRAKTDVREGDAMRYKNNTKYGKAGELKMHLIEKFDSDVEALAAGAALYNQFQDQMTEQGKYDYDDMILWVLDLFAKSKNILSGYQELFHYILVDEFQDTSGAQNKLIEYLVNYWENPNVFVVGDDDQSIYRFQGAEVKNVADFADKYAKHLVAVMLTVNYRSTQKILRAAKSHIDQNEERLVNMLPNLDKTLVPSNPLNIGIQPEVLAFKGAISEAVYISQGIQSLISKGTSPEEIAVIYRNHAHAETLAKVMVYQSIPTHFHKSENALHADFVQQLLNVLRYVEQETSQPFSGDAYLFGIMHHAAFGLSALTNARASHYIFKQRLKWRDFFEQAMTLEEGHPFTLQEQESLYNFGRKMEGLLSNAHRMSLVTFLDLVVRTSNVVEDTISKPFELECLRSVLDFISVECQNNPLLTLKQALHKIEMMDHYRIALPKEHLLYDHKGVQFMTAHASKGLEFEHVFIVNCAAKAWEKDSRGKRPYGFINLHQSEESDSNTEESRRLFYVAMTRAKLSLTMSYHQFDHNGKDVARTSFLDHMCREEVVALKEAQVDHEMNSKLLHAITFQPILSKSDLLDEHLIDTYLSSYQLSASHLNAYLSCSTAFYFEQILRVPSSKNKYMSFGIAVHRSLDQIFKLRKTEPENFTALYLRKLYEQSLFRERFVFTEKEYEDFLSLGINTLSAYFDERSPYWKTREDLRSEVVLERIEVEGVPVKGQVDLMDVEGNTVQVVDFKTGDAAKSTPRLKPPKDDAQDEDGVDAVHGGTYWRQMMFYALLVKHSATHSNTTASLNMVSGIFEFVEPDAKQEFQRHKIVVDNDGLDHMRSLIKSVYANIVSRNFMPGCGLEDCKWCTFVGRQGNNSAPEGLIL